MIWVIVLHSTCILFIPFYFEVVRFSVKVLTLKKQQTINGGGLIIPGGVGL